MKHYIGLDVSLKTVSICILSEQNKIVYETCVDTDPQIIFETIKATNLPIEKVALETGGISHWLTKELKKLGLPVICIDARKMASAIAMKVNKTDKNDAREIANALRTDYFKEVYQKTDCIVEAQTLLTARRQLVEQRTQTSNCIKGILKAQGKLDSGSSRNCTKFVASVRELIKILPKDVQTSLEALINVYSSIYKEILRLEEHIEQIVQDDEDVQLLMTIPGIGEITAVTYKLEIGDPKRFAKSRSVGAFVGMTPTQYSSGATHKQGSISKTGSKELRSLLTEAGMSVIFNTRAWSKLKAFGWKIKKKHGNQKAKVAVGRKLAVIMHRMLISRKPFTLGDVSQKEIEKLLQVSNREKKKSEKKERKIKTAKAEINKMAEALV